MGIVLPDIVDQALDLVGIDWPNVDEDDYTEMADSLREFAEKFEGHGGDAHKAFTRILSSSEGWAVDSMEKHWSYVKTSHLEKIPDVARTFAFVCDRIAEIIIAMKTKATVELGVLAGTIVAELAASGVTLGISAAAAAAEIVLMRQIVKRLVKEAIEEILAEIAARLAEPVTAKLEELAIDTALDLLEGAFDPNGTGHGGPDGMNLASAGGAGGGGGAGKRTLIDHVEFEDGAGKVSLHGVDLGGKAHVHLGKAKGAFGRTKGRDGFTATFDHALEKALDAATKSVTRTAKHVTDEIPQRVKAASRHQKSTDHKIGTRTDGIDVTKVDASGGAGGGGGGGGGNGGGGGRGSGDGPRRMDPQPGWHGRSAGQMRHYRRDAMHVDHLDPETQRRVLVDEARNLADDAQKASNGPDGQPVLGRARIKQGCAGALMHDGVLTGHSSVTKLKKANPQSPEPQQQLNTHPALQSVLDDVKRQAESEGDVVGTGHGQCTEVALISDRLHAISERDGVEIRSAEDIRRVMDGAQVHTRQIGDMNPNRPGYLSHGDYKKPCPSCERMLPLVNVTAV
ncbi:YwqJ-related putative deaminase [Streptomyces kunmingensis]|uniref:YwqJ-related putative deaminase n=1 Tax=Streptomyces kunmingensis TaxID=68225 RepID=A0ABU6CF41_9ACTN|nr:YwqJ-related putative deaminase [Streptomyces kunmingensis]MEB3963338.1 YwqJ-related putative deaminase [Streptomyces kunmingensis]